MPASSSTALNTGAKMPTLGLGTCLELPVYMDKVRAY